MVFAADVRNSRMRKLNLFASLFAVLLICLAAQQTFACLCEPMSPKKRAKFMKINADAIFTGTVLSAVQISVSTWETTLLVKDSWKGQTSGEIKVQSSGGCRVGFVVGMMDLVYGKRDKDGVLVTEVCWGTASVEFRKDDMKRLGKPIRSKTSDSRQSRYAAQPSLSLSPCI